MHALLHLTPLLSALLTSLTQTLANPVAAPPINSNKNPNGNYGLSLNLPSSNGSSLSSTSPLNLNLSSLPLTAGYSNNSSVMNGINCRGSVFGCMGAAGQSIMHVLRDYMSLLEKYPKLYYMAGQKIACKERFLFGGYYCAFIEGENVPPEGVNGTLLLLKMKQLIEHGCQGCGSVPLEPGNDASVMGRLTVNFVAKSECVGLCLYGKGKYMTQIRFDGDSDGSTASRRIGVHNDIAAAEASDGQVPGPTSTPGVGENAVQARTEFPAFQDLRLKDLWPELQTTTATSAGTTSARSTETVGDATSVVSMRYIPGVTLVPGPPDYDISNFDTLVQVSPGKEGSGTGGS